MSDEMMKDGSAMSMPEETTPPAGVEEKVPEEKDETTTENPVPEVM